MANVKSGNPAGSRAAAKFQSIDFICFTSLLNHLTHFSRHIEVSLVDYNSQNKKQASGHTYPKQTPKTRARTDHPKHTHETDTRNTCPKWPSETHARNRHPKHMPETTIRNTRPRQTPETRARNNHPKNTPETCFRNRHRKEGPETSQNRGPKHLSYILKKSKFSQTWTQLRYSNQVPGLLVCTTE